MQDARYSYVQNGHAFVKQNKEVVYESLQKTPTILIVLLFSGQTGCLSILSAFQSVFEIFL